MSAEDAKAHALAVLRIASESPDTEEAHGEADDALCDLLEALGYSDVVEAWHKVPKWYA